MPPVLNILKGISGQFEITRVLGALGVFVYIVATHVFVGWTVFYQGKGFDVVAYCAAFPAGLAVAIGVIATAAGIKDKAVASATVTRDTGSLPGQPSAIPAEVTVVNRPNDPVPTTESKK